MGEGSVSSEMASARRADVADPGAMAGASGRRVWVERLRLTDFRNYRSLSLSVGPAPVVLSGANGSGKTNLLEAVSLLTSGQGLRRAPYPELARVGATAWAVAARLNTPLGGVDIGTGLAEGPDADRRPERSVARNTGRIVRVDGEPQSGSGVLADHVEMVWLIPAMDGLFTGPASDHSSWGFNSSPLNLLKVVIPMPGFISTSSIGTGRRITVSRCA